MVAHCSDFFQVWASSSSRVRTASSSRLMLSCGEKEGPCAAGGGRPLSRRLLPQRHAVQREAGPSQAVTTKRTPPSPRTPPPARGSLAPHLQRHDFVGDQEEQEVEIRDGVQERGGGILRQVGGQTMEVLNRRRKEDINGSLRPGARPAEGFKADRHPSPLPVPGGTRTRHLTNRRQELQTGLLKPRAYLGFP